MLVLLKIVLLVLLKIVLLMLLNIVLLMLLKIVLLVLLVFIVVFSVAVCCWRCFFVYLLLTRRSAFTHVASRSVAHFDHYFVPLIQLTLKDLFKSMLRII